MVTLGTFPIVGSLYLPILLSSFIAGVLFLIFNEKNKKKHLESSTQNKEHEQKIDESTKDTLGVATLEAEKISNISETLAIPLAEKHACSGSPKTCATKKLIDVVKIVTTCSDSQEIKDVLFKLITKSSLVVPVNFTTTSATLAGVDDAETLLTSLEPTHVAIFLIGAEDVLELLQNWLCKIKNTNNNFNYCFAYLRGDEENKDLLVEMELDNILQSLGGEQWLPKEYLPLIMEDSFSIEESSLKSLSKFSQIVIKKVKKSSKKCCGKSCSKKTVDIEDLAIINSTEQITSDAKPVDNFF